MVAMTLVLSVALRRFNAFGPAVSSGAAEGVGQTAR
jgi:hypothetical protein